MKSRTKPHPQKVAEPVEREDLGVHKIPLSGFVQISTILMSSDYEEDLDDFSMLSTEYTSGKAESLVGAYRAESTDQWTAANGITTKSPPLFIGFILGSNMRS